MKSAVLSVVYPDVEPFISDFLKSINFQEDKNFELLLINDRFKHLNGYLKKLTIKNRVKEAGGTPAALRKEGIKWALEEGFDVIIFADADDCLDKNRVKISLEILQYSPMVFNELVLFGDNHSSLPLLSNRMQEGDRIREKDLRQWNCLGLSNTAVKSRAIAGTYWRIPDYVKAYDWALFARSLAKGQEAVFTGRTFTCYRQHHNNTAGPYAMRDEQIMRGLRIKLEHYYNLIDLDPWYEKEYRIYQNLLRDIQLDFSFKKDYCKAVRSNLPSFPFWWEPIKKPEDLCL